MRPSRPPTGARVLIVDDDEDIREAIQDALEAVGYATDLASNGAEAKELLDRTLPGAIVLDLWMPIMNGPQFLEWLATEKSTASIPVIVVTAAPRDAPPGFPVLPKPIDLDALLGWLDARCA
jgi:CheY-like chemotaxis protein